MRGYVDLFDVSVVGLINQNYQVTRICASLVVPHYTKVEEALGEARVIRISARTSTSSPCFSANRHFLNYNFPPSQMGIPTRRL